MQLEKAAVMHQSRFNFMREARIWYSCDPNQDTLPGGLENQIVLSDEFFREVTTHSIPTDLEAAKALSSAPAALDLFMWLSYRCFTAKGPERIPILGDFGLAGKLGSADYARPRKFGERLERWLLLVSEGVIAGMSGADYNRWRLLVDRACDRSEEERSLKWQRLHLYLR